MEWKRKRLRIVIIIINKPPLFHSLFIIFFLFSISSSLFFRTTIGSTITTCPDIRSCSSPVRAGRRYFQESEMIMVSNEVRVEGEQVPHLSSSARRHLLGGLGSSPPRCLWKCGSCTPCKPVHVPVPPGTPVTAEYYPEAWRCKCGNKLYMP